MKLVVFKNVCKLSESSMPLLLEYLLPKNNILSFGSNFHLLVKEDVGNCGPTEEGWRYLIILLYEFHDDIGHHEDDNGNGDDYDYNITI